MKWGLSASACVAFWVGAPTIRTQTPPTPSPPGDAGRRPGHGSHRSTPQATGECIHGGALRQVALPGETDCAGLFTYGGFNCALVSGRVAFSADGLVPGVRLIDLIDASGPDAWRGARPRSPSRPRPT